MTKRASFTNTWRGKTLKYKTKIVAAISLLVLSSCQGEDEDVRFCEEATTLEQCEAQGCTIQAHGQLDLLTQDRQSCTTLRTSSLLCFEQLTLIHQEYGDNAFTYWTRPRPNGSLEVLTINTHPGTIQGWTYSTGIPSDLSVCETPPD